MEIQSRWRTSSYTSPDSCVEAADHDPTVVRVRDTKCPEHGRMHLRPATWVRFMAFTKRLPL
ncbi:DUF397 domain-containing protein [Streptomyces sp. WAC 05379]|uniref:DUF397 domain-containing protein n=1 Tax=Streptomyces sp. WAC 05379 TaxID=2203207 RepID=UPI000F73D4E9|nr:DUF397 domain-containing protein [Streptomyces sp. WAC 05379]RSO09997.1 DUF397 domain-containing protein [Streptomyces sp. WAC 05379]